MDWSALIGAVIGAGIPTTLAYVGLHQKRRQQTLRHLVPPSWYSTGSHLQPRPASRGGHAGRSATASRWGS
jgi:hypothetical protein